MSLTPSASPVLGSKVCDTDGCISVDTSPVDPLGRHLANAAKWAAALRGVEKLLAFGRTVVLARILAPEDFGLFGVALIALSALEAFTQTGLQSALVQKKEELRSYFDTAWTIQAVRGVLLTGAMYGAAPWIAAFLEEMRAVPLLRVLGLVALFRGLENIGMVRVQRKLDFRKQSFYTLSGTVLDLAVTVGSALILRSPWALVLGLVAGQAGRTVASYFVDPFRPRISFRFSELRELSAFGRWIAASNILGFLTLRGDNAVIAKLLGPVALGAYEMAFRLSELLTRELATVVGNVSFPAYARMSEDMPRLSRAYGMALELVAAITLPVGLVTCFFAVPLTEIVLGPQWGSTAAVLPYLAVAGSLRSLAATAGPAYAGVGRPKLNFHMHVLRVLVTLGLIVPLTLRYGLRGAGMAVLIGGLTLLPQLVYYNRTVLQMSFAETTRTLTPAAVLCLAVTVVALVGRSLMADGSISGALLLLAAVIAGYLLIAAVIWQVYAAGPFRVLKRLHAGG